MLPHDHRCCHGWELQTAAAGVRSPLISDERSAAAASEHRCDTDRRAEDLAIDDVRDDGPELVSFAAMDLVEAV